MAKLPLFLTYAVSTMRLLNALEASIIIPTLCQVLSFEDPKFREEDADSLLLHVSEDVVRIRAEMDVGFEVIENGEAVDTMVYVLLGVFLELLGIGQLP